MQNTTTHNKDEWHSLLEKFTSHFIERFVCERELDTEQRLQHIDLPSPSGHSRVSFSFSWTAQPGACSPTPLGAGFIYRILSPTGLVSTLTDFLSSLSYIIVQSPTQSLEWHVWSSSSGNNCHAVHRSLSSGAIRQKQCKKFKFCHKNKWYKHCPEFILENETHKLHWNFEIQTDN